MAIHLLPTDSVVDFCHKGERRFLIILHNYQGEPNLTEGEYVYYEIQNNFWMRGRKGGEAKSSDKRSWVQVLAELAVPQLRDLWQVTVPPWALVSSDSHWRDFKEIIHIKSTKLRAWPAVKLPVNSSYLISSCSSEWSITQNKRAGRGLWTFAFACLSLLLPGTHFLFLQ